MFQGVTLTAVDSYDEYCQHFSNVDKDEATHMYQFYKKQLQILAYNQGKTASSSSGTTLSTLNKNS